MTPALRIQGLTKEYDAPKGSPAAKFQALKGVDLDIPAGSFFGLLGQNGAGKTTLISIVSGLTVKTAGSVEVSGTSIDIDPDLAKTHIGLVPQEFNFNMFEKVQDIVVAQAGYYGIPRKEAAERSEKVLKDLGLWEKRDAKSMELSGGMKRRLMIARALIHQPRILLLDEPTAGVDVELRRSMWEFLRELNASGTTILLTTHYLEEAEDLCSEIAIIQKGTVIRKGTVKELLSDLAQAKLLLDTVEPITDAVLALLKGYPVRKVDEHTLELTIAKGETANDTFRKLSTVGIGVKNVRNPGSALEEVFVQIIEKD